MSVFDVCLERKACRVFYECLTRLLQLRQNDSTPDSRRASRDILRRSADRVCSVRLVVLLLLQRARYNIDPSLYHRSPHTATRGARTHTGPGFLLPHWRRRERGKNVLGVFPPWSGRPGTFLQNQLRVGYTTESYVGVSRGGATGVDGFAGCRRKPFGTAG